MRKTWIRWTLSSSYWEKVPHDRHILGSVFRTIHTINGTCGFLGFAKLEKVAHAGESLRSSLRDGTLEVNTAIADGLLSMVDAVRRMLAEIQETGKDSQTEYRDLIENLTKLQESTLEAKPPNTQKKTNAQTPPKRNSDRFRSRPTKALNLRPYPERSERFWWSSWRMSTRLRELVAQFKVDSNGHNGHRRQAAA